MKITKQQNPRKRLKNLLQRQVKPPVISLYIPTSPVWQNNEKAQIHLKNKTDEIEKLLKKSTLPASKINDLLKPLKKIQQNTTFWQEQKDGLAIFRSETYTEMIKFPKNVDAQFYVSDIPNVKPLVPYVFGSSTYYVLALSYSHITLYRGVNRNWEKKEPTVMPEDIEETLRTHDIQSQLQRHPAGGARPGEKPTQRAHGHGSQESAIDEQQKVFLDEVDWALNHFVTDIEDDKRPLVILAADTELYNKFSDFGKYPNLADDYVEGNPEEAAAEDILKEAWKIVKDRIDEKRMDFVDSYKEHKASEQVVEGLEKVAPAAFEEKISVLFVNPSRTIWGNYSVENRGAIVEEERGFTNRDLVNFLVVKTLLSGGEIVPLTDAMSTELNLKDDLGAILRF
ncbi:hypothetical protein GF360_03275 [candidate division WWE3 bacterium]|nr:hypothetical protein [candidate division WWE3 bacterium]